MTTTATAIVGSIVVAAAVVGSACRGDREARATESATPPASPARTAAPAPAPAPAPVLASRRAPAGPADIDWSAVPVVDDGFALEFTDDTTIFATNAFPPTLSDTDWHRRSWAEQDCLRCHETGVGDAPMVLHDSVPTVALDAKCRTCHVFVPGSTPRERPPTPTIFDDNAFPPMIPNSPWHRSAWGIENCLLCHETGNLGAPFVIHKDMPTMLLRVKCRTCHPQARAIEGDLYR